MGRYLIDQSSVDRRHLSAVGYADTHPRVSNDSEEGHSSHRRIVLYPKDLKDITSQVKASAAPMLNRFRMLKKARLLTRPAPARQDAPFRRQGRSERRGEEVPTALVRPFARIIDLGERESPSGDSDILGAQLYTLSL